MPEFKITKESGVKKFEIQMAIDFDEEGEIENQEYSNGDEWSDNPSDLRICTSYCDEEEQEEWNVFFNDFMYLLESNELIDEVKKLKNIGDSYFFNEEDMEVEFVVVDL
ncbi:MAG: hypothetical protein KO202_04600 [Methanobacteriaceae archaeon]|jgi:hypothetical protein|nr:hypothetical protein [Methanobacteriaceae archaeon]